MNKFDFPAQKPATRTTDGVAITSLATSWAKKYTENLSDPKVVPQGGRNVVARHLLDSLRATSIDAWHETEQLLAAEVRRHSIDADLIDPWQISQDIYGIYKKAIDAYGNNLIPRKLSLIVGSDIGHLRRKYTSQDPRVIGFASMQFHLSGKHLLASLPQLERSRVSDYFKVVDDHLYMPLHRAYEAASHHDEDSPPLGVVHCLLPESSKIAQEVYSQTLCAYPDYQCYTGSLSDREVGISSLRDVEMFQVYLWICLLEESVSILQQELFPLCLMLYPTLGVNWELVRQLVHQVTQSINARLDRDQVALFKPYLQCLWELFSPEVFPTTLSKEQIKGAKSRRVQPMGVLSLGR